MPSARVTNSPLRQRALLPLATFVVLAFSFLSRLAAADPLVAWTVTGAANASDQKAFSSGGYFAKNTIAADGFGNTFVTGTYFDGEHNHYLTIKYDANGTVQWQAIGNGADRYGDYATATAVDKSGNVYVTGYSVNGGGYEYLTIKYDGNGIEQWRMTANGGRSDYPMALAVDGGGNVYVTGYSINAANLTDLLTIKYSTTGVEQWRAVVNEPVGPYSLPLGVAVDLAGNVYLTGTFPHDSVADFLTIKYNSDGAEQWRRQAKGAGGSIDLVYASAVDANGDVYVTGTTYNGVEASLTVKYNSSGVEQWQVVDTSGQGLGERTNALAVDSEGNVYVAGYAWDSVAHPHRFVTIKYDADGLQQWRTLADAAADQDEIASALTVDSAGRVYVTGQSTSGSGTPDFLADFLTIAYSPSGTELWRAGVDGAGGSAGATGIAIDGGGGILVTGFSSNSATSDLLTVKYDSGGVEQWRRNEGLVLAATIFGSGDPYSNKKALAVDAAGNTHVVGRSYNGNDYDYLTIKYDVNGIEQWRATAAGAAGGADWPYALAVDSSGNVYVAGSSGNSASTTDFMTLKYDASGVEKWRAVAHGPVAWGNDRAVAIAVDGANNGYVTGTTIDAASSQTVYLTIKYDSNGVEQWRATTNQGGGYIPEAIAVQGNGNVYVSGSSYYDCLTVSYDPHGTERWHANCPDTTPGGTFTLDHRGAKVSAMTIDGSGNAYIAVAWGVPGQRSYLTIKYDANGAEQWRASDNSGFPNTDNTPAAIGVDGSGNVYVVGQTYNAAENKVNIMTLRYTAVGTLVWRNTSNAPAGTNSEAFAMNVDVGGNVYVTGRRDDGTNDEFVTIKYDRNGVEQWRVSTDDPSGDRTASALALGPGNSIHVAGQSDALTEPRAMMVQKILDGVSSTIATVTSSANPAAAGQSLTFNATVTGNAPLGSVDFLDGSTVICQEVALPAQGNTPTVSCSTSALVAGGHTITAIYSGDKSNASSASSPLVESVFNVSSAVSLTSSRNPSTLGQSVTFTAKVAGSSPTGTVDFRDGFTVVCQGVTLISDFRRTSAACATNSLSQGTHSITATYSGDSKNPGGTSSVLIQNVSGGPANGVSLVSSLNPSHRDQLVTFTATVTGHTPTGTVTFLDGAQIIAGCGSIVLSASKATCSTATLTRGTHSITAAYSGDANNAGSTSSVLSQVVKR
jgi:uncharacterized delta-60 repeat protein